MGVAIDVAKSAEEAVRNTDLVVTATTAQRTDLKMRVVEARRAYQCRRLSSPRLPGNRRPDRERVESSRRFTRGDHGRVRRYSAWRSKRKASAENHLHGEIGEVLAGNKTGRSSASEITLYKSVGIAIQDVATAQLVYRKALELKVGTNVEI